jgi:hypothetical protein
MEYLLASVGVEDAEGAAKLYAKDPSSRLAIIREASKGSWGDGTIIPCDSQGGISPAICLLCLKFQGASEEGEPLLAAGMISRVARATRPLPMVSEDNPAALCAKTLVSLSLYLPAMILRWKKRGAPAPRFYRDVSAGILKGGTDAHRALAAHHRGWENFLHEQLCPEVGGAAS